MKITSNYSPNFGLKFVKNNAFKEVKEYAESIKRSNEFNKALKRLETAVSGDVTIFHGIEPETGKSTSRFYYKDIAVINTPYDHESYIEASYRCLIDLATLDGRYRALTKDINHFRY